MNFEWDEAKRERNLEKHGIDFVDCAALFDGRPALTVQSRFADEARFLTTGLVEKRLITVVWTMRGENMRFISARRAREAERRRYDALHS